MRTKKVSASIRFWPIAITIVMAVMAPSIRLQARQEGKPDAVQLADGTPIHLLLMDDLQGKKLQVKQTVHFKVRQDLVVNSKLIVRTGTEAIGHIESISKKGLLGKSGRLILQFDYVNAVSGVKIQLRGGAGVGGGKGGALTWESALWYGPDANLPVGTTINAYVNQDQQVAVP
jgi:hypothetical protein